MHTIAAISTPEAPGGIAMIRISGDQAIQIAEHIFVSYNHLTISEMAGYTCAYGNIMDKGERIDDVVLTVFRAPHSFTGEDTVEITCHGGLYVSKRILRLLFQNGAKPAEAGEFTKRAFLNGKMSLSQAEAVMDIISADGEAALKQANLAKDGYLGKQMSGIADRLVDFMSALAYWMDDAEECPPELERDTLSASLNEIKQQLDQLASDYQNGRIIRDGIRTVLLGRPNAGKSSVMNWLCGTDRSIVTDIAGTTRDIVTEQVKIGEYTLLLSDTAGLRETDHQIEQIGIRQAYQELENSEFALYVIDANEGITQEDRDILTKCPKKTLIIWNKTDLTGSEPPDLPFPVLMMAAIENPSFDGLLQCLRGIFGKAVTNRPQIMNERQHCLIESASASIHEALKLIADGSELDILYTSLEDAVKSLREINGTNVNEDVINGIFSKFCVGK